MNFKKLAIALAVVFTFSLSTVAPVSTLAPVAVAMAQDAAAPAAAPAGDKAAGAAADAVPTQYSLGHIWTEGSWISKAILIVLAIMSAGTWYIFFTKWIDQQRMLGHATQVEKKFWTSATLEEGVEKLTKNSIFRSVAEAGMQASSGAGTSLVGQNDWIGMSLTRQLEDASARLGGGVTFLGSVGSVSPFVGLLGTVMGILNALIGIGVAGQASIGKVAGPVGEALIMTALGLATAVPAVLLYNYLVRRNKVISEKLHAFAGVLQAYLITKNK
jgi:biopolymer transport protein ExbB